jgi:hypothetical protein
MKEMSLESAMFWTWAVNAVALYVFSAPQLNQWNPLYAMGASFILCIILAPAGILAIETVIIQSIVNAFYRRKNQSNATA